MNIHVSSPEQLKQHQAHKARRNQWAAKVWTPPRIRLRPKPVNVMLLRSTDYNAHVKEYLFNIIFTKQDMNQHVKDYLGYAIMRQTEYAQMSIKEAGELKFKRRCYTIRANEVIDICLRCYLKDDRISTSPNQFTIEQIKGRQRPHNLVLVRQLAMYFMIKYTGRSHVEIGGRFGGRDHTTVLHAVKRITNLIKAKKLSINDNLVTHETRIF